MTPRVGDTIADRYRLDDEARPTDVGLLYDATDRALSRRVVVELAVHLEDEGARRRWLRDAMTARRLEGDHVLRVLDAGALADGVPFVVRETAFVSLAAEVASHGPVAVAQAVAWTLEACEAIAEAHATGLAHGDLRLDNVYIATCDDPSDAPRVKVAWTNAARAERATREDVSRDVAALGTMLRILVSGQPMSEADEATTLPSGVAHVVARALTPADDARFHNVAELARALAPHAPAGHGSARRVASMMSRAGIVGALIPAPEIATQPSRIAPLPPPLTAASLAAASLRRIDAWLGGDFRPALSGALAPRPGGRGLTWTIVSLGALAVVLGAWLVRTGDERDDLPSPTTSAGALLEEVGTTDLSSASPAPEPTHTPATEPSLSVQDLPSAPAPAPAYAPAPAPLPPLPSSDSVTGDKPASPPASTFEPFEPRAPDPELFRYPSGMNPLH